MCMCVCVCVQMIFHFQDMLQCCLSTTGLSFKIFLLFIFISFGFLSVFFSFGTQSGLRYMFLKNFQQMLFKKGHKCLLSFLKLFEYLLMKFNNFKPLFCTFFYSGLFCFKYFSRFCLLVILFEGISLQIQFKIIHT